MNFVPDRGDGELEMCVVGKKRFASGGVDATDNPVVAAEAFANFALRFFEIAFDGWPERRCEIGISLWGANSGGVVSGGFQNVVGGHVVVIIVLVIGIDA